MRVFELEPEDACYLPAGSAHEYRNPGGGDRARDLRRRAELPAVTVALGIDVGGTKIAAARVDTATGEVLEARRVADARRTRGPDAVLADCVALAAALGEGPRGLAVCELVDPAGRVRSAETIDWREADLSRLRRVESDVRAAALAEARFGAGGRRTSSTSASAPGSATA